MVSVKTEKNRLARQTESPGNSGETFAISEDWAASVLPRRDASAHKWGVGGVVVVAGSPPYAGAAALSCAAAARSGAGIVSAALPRSISHIVVGLVPEVTVIPLPEGDSLSVAKRASDAIGERLERAGAMVIGPGLGRDEATSSLLGALFGAARARAGIGFGTSGPPSGTSQDAVIVASGKPVVVDADALNWLAEQDQWWTRIPEGRFVLTPHPGEMARLVSGTIEQILANPVETAREAAILWKQTVVLKGGSTIVSSPDGSSTTLEASPALATAGSGDVLSGSIAAFLAQGLGHRDAAVLAAYVGNRAAGKVADRCGILGVVAGDLPLAIAEEIAELEKLIVGA